MNNENYTSSVGDMRGQTWIGTIKGIREQILNDMVNGMRGQNLIVMVNGIRIQNLIVMVNGPIDRMQANFHVQNLNTICTHKHTRTHTRPHARTHRIAKTRARAHECTCTNAQTKKQHKNINRPINKWKRVILPQQQQNHDPVIAVSEPWVRARVQEVP